jgi:hypothetical protein
MQMENGADTPETQQGAERRRYTRQARRLAVTFTLEGEEFVAQTQDISKTGALFSAGQAPSVGTRILLNLSDRQNPELTLFLKSTVVRFEADLGNEKQFAVQFGDAVAKDPRRLRTFLDKVLGIGTGLIRVVGGEDGSEKAYAFSFESVHREGDERVKALQASLFSNFEEMEEADAILSNFGKMPTEADLASGPSPAASGVKMVRVEQKKKEKREKKKEEKKEKKKKKKKKEQKKKGDVGPPEEGAGQDAPAPAESAADGRAPRKKGFLSKFAAMLSGPGGKTKGSKGETLIQTQRMPTIVAKNTELPVVYRMGNTRFQGVATRLYCAGMKCSTEQNLPSLYATLTILIPLAGAKKISQIELQGDVTRVRSIHEDSDVGGIFEVRLSMRNDKVHLELYRTLLERMTAQ